MVIFNKKGLSMNTLRMVSHVFTVMAIVTTANLFSTKCHIANHLAPHKMTIAGIAAAQVLPKDQRLARAVTETMGFLADNGRIDDTAFITNLAVNYAIRRLMASSIIDKATDPIEEAIAKVPVVGKDVVNFCDAVIPQVVAGAVTKFVVKQTVV
jgi:hypothetical protein